jgi:hypothetical protein
MPGSASRTAGGRFHETRESLHDPMSGTVLAVIAQGGKRLALGERCPLDPRIPLRSGSAPQLQSAEASPHSP